MTERLYLADSYLRAFEARVVARRPGAVVLDRTAFYATSGGQPHDTGTIAGVAVTGVESEGDAVVHAVAGEVPDGVVNCLVDGARRADHMEQHHGQHILTRAFLEEMGADTVSFHLGADGATIDLEVRDVTEKEAERAEDLANRVVRENREVRVSEHALAEAKDLGLRKIPEGLERVRVVSIRDFDRTACGGTHPSRTGDVGQIRITGWEKTKGRVRVGFVCGGRALADARARQRALAQAAAALGVGALDAGAAAARSREEVRALSKERDALREKAAAGEAADLLAKAGPAKLVRTTLPDRDVAGLLVLSRALAAEPAAVFVLTGNACLVAGCGPSITRDFSSAFKDAVAAGAVRGGGRGRLFQAAGGTDPARLEAAADALARRLAAELA